MLGLTVSGVLHLEQNGDLVGIRDSKGRVRFKRTEVEELYAARVQARRAEPRAVLDIGEDGAYLVRAADDEFDIVEGNIDRRWKKDRELREKEVTLKERDLLMKDRLISVLAKSLPKLISAADRGSWASVAKVAIEAIPEAQRAELIGEIAAMFKK